jgi:hypothetical protein
MKEKTRRVTKMQLRDIDMGPNQFNAKTYGDWCAWEAVRVTGGYYYEETRQGVSNGDVVDKKWCCVMAKNS